MTIPDSVQSAKTLTIEVIRRLDMFTGTFQTASVRVMVRMSALQCGMVVREE